MARYATRPDRSAAPQACDDHYPEPPLLTNIDVTDSGPEWSGLYDQHGNEIWRVKDPIGFHIPGI